MWLSDGTFWPTTSSEEYGLDEPVHCTSNQNQLLIGYHKKMSIQKRPPKCRTNSTGSKLFPKRNSGRIWSSGTMWVDWTNDVWSSKVNLFVYWRAHLLLLFSRTRVRTTKTNRKTERFLLTFPYRSCSSQLSYIFIYIRRERSNNRKFLVALCMYPAVAECRQ